MLHLHKGAELLFSDCTAHCHDIKQQSLRQCLPGCKNGLYSVLASPIHVRIYIQGTITVTQ